MRPAYIALLVVAVAVFAVVMMNGPAVKPAVTTQSHTNNDIMGLGNFLSGLSNKIFAPPAIQPGLNESSRAASDAVAAGKPVSSTPGNSLMPVNFDGTYTVANV